MRADFTTSFKDSLRGEPKKKGRGGEGRGRQLSPQSLSPFPSPISLPSPLLSTPPTEATKREFCAFQNMG